MSETNKAHERRLAILETLILKLDEQVQRLSQELEAATRVGTSPRSLPARVGDPDGINTLGALQPTPETGAGLEVPDSRWIPIIHRFTRGSPTAPKACGYPGLYLTRRFRESEPADRTAMRILDTRENVWREPRPDDVPVCSSCGARIDPFSSGDLDYLSEALPDDRRISEEGTRVLDSRVPPPRFPNTYPDMTLTGFSPGPEAEHSRDGVLPSIFPGHSSRADAQVALDLGELQKLADDLGLGGPVDGDRR